jgi:hypothetical protein
MRLDQSDLQRLRQLAAMNAAVTVVLAGVKAGGETGAPGGVIYAAMQEHGANLSQYESLMGALERTGMVRREDHGDAPMYWLTEAGGRRLATGERVMAQDRAAGLLGRRV